VAGVEDEEGARGRGIALGDGAALGEIEVTEAGWQAELGQREG